MPSILGYTPRWLSRPSPGFDVFAHHETQSLGPSPGSSEATGSTRRIANRGTQLFVAVKNELRWSDLAVLKDQYDTNHDAPESYSEDGAEAQSDNTTRRPYRVLKTPVQRDIQQLVVSPAGDYLAIVTSHTVHVALLPDPSHFESTDTSPLRLKTFQVGPTSHVLERPGVATVLWHPLGVDGTCLVTITRDAVVRVWETNRDNRWSFDEPALALDLQKLSYSSSALQDFSPSKYGTNTAFSPDTFDLETVAACFGGTGHEDEVALAPMTLWVATRGGDLYSLCPLLPSKFMASTEAMTQLLREVSVKDAALAGVANSKKEATRTVKQQSTWALDIMEQDQKRESISTYEIYQRPSNPGPTPRLQGPYSPVPDLDQGFEVTDISAIAACAQADEDEDEEDAGDEMSLKNAPVGVLYVADTSGQVRICLDLGGTEASWLPSIHSNMSSPLKQLNQDGYPELVVAETLRICSGGSRPTFTADPSSRNAVFVTHRNGVSHVSPSNLFAKLNQELSGAGAAGGAFRLQLLLEQALMSVSTSIRLLDGDAESQTVPTACLVIQDADMGEFVLTVADGQPHAAELDLSDALLGVAKEYREYEPGSAKEEAKGAFSRASYQPPADLWAEWTLMRVNARYARNRDEQYMHGPIKLSPATLDQLIETHRALSAETTRVETAVNYLFARCNRLQEEFKAQVGRVNEVARRIEGVLGEDGDVSEGLEEDDEGTRASVERRLEAIKARQTELEVRHAKLKGKLATVHRQPLNEKERRWVRQIGRLEELVSGGEGEEEQGRETPSERFSRVEGVTRALLKEAQGYRQDEDEDEEQSPARERGLPGQISGMLERETALVEATREKLENLNRVRV